MKLKEQGNESFNKKDYITACSSYDKGIPYLHFAVPFTSEPDIIESDKEHEEEIKAGQELAFILHNNKAMCCIKLGDYHAAIVEVWIGISFVLTARRSASLFCPTNSVAGTRVFIWAR